MRKDIKLLTGIAAGVVLGAGIAQSTDIYAATIDEAPVKEEDINNENPTNTDPYVEENNNSEDSDAVESENEEAQASEDEIVNTDSLSATDEAATTYTAWIGEQGYATLEDAIAASKDGDTITIGSGYYSAYNKTVDGKSIDNYSIDKTLTFVGAGAESTTWVVGAEVPDPAKEHTEYNGDYSFQQSKSITFKNMTLQVATTTYKGFIRGMDYNTENCVINGTISYWGHGNGTFTNTTFNSGSETGDEYAFFAACYSCQSMTFNNCTFNTKNGRVINAYDDYETGKNYVININNCTVNADKAGKSMVNIKEGRNNYTVNFTGTNTINGLTTNKYTCSKLFQVEQEKGSVAYKATVTIDGVKVWETGSGIYHDGMIAHEVDTANDKYTDGYEEHNIVETTIVDWTPITGTNIEYKVITRNCGYCGYSYGQTTLYRVSDQVTLDGDILINGDTENKQVYEVSDKSQDITLTGTLDVSPIPDKMTALERPLQITDYASVAISNLDFTMTSTLTLPDELDASNATFALAGSDSYEIKSSKVEGNTVTIVMGLKDAESITDYGKLKTAVGSTQLLQVNVSGVKFKDSAKADTEYTVVGTVTGSFSAKATKGTYELNYSSTYNAVQSKDGKDVVAKDDDTIQATLKFKESSKPVTPSKPTNNVTTAGTSTGVETDVMMYVGSASVAALGAVSVSLKKRKALKRVNKNKDLY